MTLARELGLVVNIHSGSEISHPLAIGALARRFPDVTVRCPFPEPRLRPSPRTPTTASLPPASG
jgi:hypothetical protein